MAIAELLRQAQAADDEDPTGGTAKTSVEMSCRRSWPFERVRCRRRYCEAMAALEAEAQAAAEQAEAEGGHHPGVPD